MSNIEAENAIKKIEEFQRFGSILGLERMTSLLERLGNPQDELKVIHVAGTNGKGSICKYIYSVLRAGGYKVGLYTSPYLEVFNERIEFDGSYISDDDLNKYTEKVLAKADEMVAEGEQSPTEFEIITAIAFLYFRDQICDYVVLEVGLGGRGDSTNVCKEPLASVIASISYDHTDRLGNTLAEIAGEKAGIIKDGCPVITSADSDEALAVIESEAAKHKSMYFETRNIPYKVIESTANGCKFNVNIQGVEFDNLEISMLGAHQIKNAVAALATLNIIEENGQVQLSREAIYKGFKAAKQIGRFEIMTGENQKPAVILDGAHNPDGARALRSTVEEFCRGKKILMVTGILADKDVDLVLKEFSQITKDFIVTEPDNPRKLSAGELALKIGKLGGKCIVEQDFKSACEIAAKKSDDFDYIVFAGSLYLIGDVRKYIRKNWLG